MEETVEIKVTKLNYFKIVAAIIAAQMSKGVADKALGELVDDLVEQGTEFMTKEDVDALQEQIKFM